MKIQGVIRLPRCWKRLVDTVFEETNLPTPQQGLYARCWKRLVDTVFEETNLPTPQQGLYARLPNGRRLIVTSERHVNGISDPMPHYDECRTVGVNMPDGAHLQLDLCSGQSNYYAGAMMHDKGEIIYESDDPIESLVGPLELSAFNGNTYVVEIEWIGDDPYEIPVQISTEQNATEEKLCQWAKELSLMGVDRAVIHRLIDMTLDELADQ
jgi:hypothetical protein